MDSHCPYLLYQLAMIHVVEKSFYIELNYIVQMSQLHEPIGSVDCVFCWPARSETIAIFTEFRLAYRFHHLFDTLLDQPIPDTWNTKWTGFRRIIGLWDVFAPYRLWAIPMWTSCCDESDFIHDLFGCQSANVTYGKPICSSGFTPCIGLDVPIRQENVFTAQNQRH